MTDKIDILNADELTKIKWLCRDIYITVDRQVFNIYTLSKLNERVVNGCYGYTVEGKFRTKQWINARSFVISNLVDL
jgi:hypothetical protein